MSTISTTKMSSKGQVVIPEEIREKLGLINGSRFVIVGDKDVVILKTIQEPSLTQFDGLIKKIRKQAKNVGVKRNDIKAAIKQARS